MESKQILNIVHDLGRVRNMACSFGAGLMVWACQSTPSPTVSKEEAALPKSQIVASSRGGKIQLFPCLDCHNKISGDRAFSYVEKHKDLKFNHFVGIKQCRMCHNEHDMNTLRLFTGETIAIDDSQRLCGQCHGEKLRDWSIGAHGKLVGGWKGKKHRQTCADCHHPHTPGRSQVLAQPAPPFPQFGIPKGAHE